VTESSGTGRCFLVALVLLGLFGFAGPYSTGATFTDAHDALGTVEAADSFQGVGPTADAGGPYTVLEGGNFIQLDGTGSTTQGSATYQWQKLSGPGTLYSTNDPEPFYQSPSNVSSNTSVSVELNVTDSQGWDTDTATITVLDTDGTNDTTPPTISNFDARFTANRQVTVSFDSSEKLYSIRVWLVANNDYQILGTNDFQTSDTQAPYTYTATVSVSSNARRTAYLTKAKDLAGNDGANGQQDST